MGTYYVNAILNGLKGRETIGDKKLSATWIALLVSIANKQPNPGSFHGDMDPICIGDPKTMAEYAHISEPEVYKVRNFLVESGLITYSRRECRVDPTCMGEEQTFYNVYRINLKTLRAFHPNVEQWKRKILRISNEDESSEGVLRVLMALPDSNPKLHEVESKLHEVEPKLYEVEPKLYEVESKLYEVDTNINKTKTKTNNNKEKCSDVVAADVVDSVIDAISNSLGVPKNKIGRKKISDVIKGKLIDSVYKVVNNPSDFVRRAENPIGAIIDELSRLSAKKDDPKFLDMAKKQEYERKIQGATPDVRSMLRTIQTNIGFSDLRFLVDMVTYLTKLLYYNDEKRNEAIEICDHYKFEESEERTQEKSLKLAKALHKELRMAYLKCFEKQSSKETNK